MNDEHDTIPMLLEAHIDGEWSPIRVAREFPNARAALASLPMFARQQKVSHVNTRVKALRTIEQIDAAVTAVAAHNTRTVGGDDVY